MYPYINEEKNIFASEEELEVQIPSQRIAQLINQALIEEVSSVYLYDTLADNSKNELCTKQYRSIANDDRFHIKLLKEMYKDLTGIDPPDNWEDSANIDIKTVNETILNEIETAKFYRDLLAAVEEDFLKDKINYIINDKQNHAILNTYLLTVCFNE
ncbi:MAG: ferritin-like domain-containing protein [Firmicutes bacterium]|nr:ferritin-like domain-containing protein [Bacillota bacterium]